ncbi:hypothetical protein LLS1_06000 [Leifsonia sp. LS1]|uniref:hypothetical protein n=1 Tax=Leifsonia sp. LS1 TaxID=2828483 RepID=UPI001CFE7133|nr:hypothetical protein [Leifsonia sp. LS1]GIT78931.1 hypothetical protein LLS1_06000 [Leifsonia sp. LS1]
MRAARWRSSAILREAALNVIALRSRMILGCTAAVFLGATAASFYAYESTQFQTVLASGEAKGSRLISFQSASPEREVLISRASCEALTRDSGVIRAGLLIDEGTRDFPELGARTPIYTASSSLFPGLLEADGLIGADLSAAPTRVVTFGPSDQRRLSSSPKQPEGIPTNRAVVVPVDALEMWAPTCIAEVSRFSNVRSASSNLASQLVVSGGAIAGRVHLSESPDPVAGWTSRPGQLLPVVLGAVGGILNSVLVWTRSSEVAAYRLSGTSPHSLGLILTIESLFLAGAFFLSGASAVVALQGMLISSTELQLWLVAGSSTWLVSALPGTLRSVLASPASLTRER